MQGKWKRSGRGKKSQLALAAASVSRHYGNDTSSHPFSSPLSFPSFPLFPFNLIRCKHRLRHSNWSLVIVPWLELDSTLNRQSNLCLKNRLPKGGEQRVCPWLCGILNSLLSPPLSLSLSHTHTEKDKWKGLLFTTSLFGSGCA